MRAHLAGLPLTERERLRRRSTNERYTVDSIHPHRTRIARTLLAD
ncbi:hypothetical protein ACIRRH_41895 [Kitasatospora sp. NPDC101235]